MEQQPGKSGTLELAVHSHSPGNYFHATTLSLQGQQVLKCLLRAGPASLSHSSVIRDSQKTLCALFSQDVTKPFPFLPPTQTQPGSGITTGWDITELRLEVLIQGEAPRGVLLVAGVPAVGVAPVELGVPGSSEGVGVGVLRVPGLALPPRARHAHRAPVIHARAVVALVICKDNQKPKPRSVVDTASTGTSCWHLPANSCWPSLGAWAPSLLRLQGWACFAFAFLGGFKASAPGMKRASAKRF